LRTSTRDTETPPARGSDRRGGEKLAAISLP
jgi:hypothetical protein